MVLILVGLKIILYLKMKRDEFMKVLSLTESFATLIKEKKEIR